MAVQRIDEQRAKAISKVLKRYERLKGGKARVERGAMITDRIFYRALGGGCIEVEKAERLEKFFETDKI